jgi:hypothetical protein
VTQEFVCSLVKPYHHTAQKRYGAKYRIDISGDNFSTDISLSGLGHPYFTGPDGEVYVWTKAPMGLTNPPATFQMLTAHVLQGIPGVSVCNDDITVYTASWEDHIATLQRVFSRLQAARLKAQFAKFVWAAAVCRVLGSIVSEQGMPDPDKVAAVTHSQLPAT